MAASNESQYESVLLLIVKTEKGLLVSTSGSGRFEPVISIGFRATFACGTTAIKTAAFPWTVVVKPSWWPIPIKLTVFPWPIVVEPPWCPISVERTVFPWSIVVEPPWCPVSIE